jgi:hypothetical protein
MFSFFKKKPAAVKPAMLAPVVLPASFAKSREHCAVGIAQYIHWITEVYGYLPEEIPPVIHRAKSVLVYVDCLIEKGHGRYVAGIAKGEFDPDLTADTLAQLGAEELHSIHADAVRWLQTHAADVTSDMYVVGADELKALDKRPAGPLCLSVVKQVVAMVSQDPSVHLVPDRASLKDERERIVHAHPSRDHIRVRQLEKTLADPVVAGLRLSLGWQTLKKDNTALQITGIRIGSRNHHPTDPKGIVYWLDTNHGPFLGYQDRLGWHIAVSARKPDEPPINVLTPGDVAFTVSAEKVDEAIRIARTDNIAFLAVALLDGYGLGKDINYLAFERQMKIDGLPGEVSTIYRIVAARDSSVWLAVLNDGNLMLAKPDMRSFDIVFTLNRAQIAKLHKRDHTRMH